jgi:hypothetical protein
MFQSAAIGAEAERCTSGQAVKKAYVCVMFMKVCNELFFIGWKVGAIYFKGQERGNPGCWLMDRRCAGLFNFD